MEVTAKHRAIIDWDAQAGQTVVINKGETGEISETLARVHWDAWNDEPLPESADLSEGVAAREAPGRGHLPQLDHDGDGFPGGSAAPEGSGDLKELRKAYEAVVGKRPFSGWDAAELKRRMDEARNIAAPEGSGDDDDVADGPPV